MRGRRQYLLTAATVFWCIVLLGVGFGHRWLNRVLKADAGVPAVLKQPLSTLPMRIGSWHGYDIPIDAKVMQVAGTDDHVVRRYVHEVTGDSVDIFLAYTSRPVNMVGHYPEKCYPSNGWRADGDKTVSIPLADGKSLESVIHYFSREDVVTEGRVVLNYFVLQGKHTTQGQDFWGPKWRLPNLSRDPNYYVAQLQVVAAVPSAADYDRAESAVTRFAAVSAEEVDRLLPLTNEPFKGLPGSPREEAAGAP